MKDRAMQALHCWRWNPSRRPPPTQLLWLSTWPKRSTADAIQQLFQRCAGGSVPQWVLEGDIQRDVSTTSATNGCSACPTDKEVLQKWLKAGYMENRTLFPTEAGTPQGGIISPTLANLTLDGLEKLLKQHFPREKWKDGKIWRPKVNLIRYADDFIITGATKECWKMKSSHWSSSS
jgi:RNA-directed DNA polymerase